MTPLAADILPPLVLSELAAGAAVDTAKLEKARQKSASLYYTNVYTWIATGLVFLFVLRNLLLVSQRFLTRQRSDAAVGSEKGRTKEAGAVTYGNKPTLLRWSDKVDGLLLSPVNVWGVPADWTYLRLILATFICAINIAFCLVITTQFITPQSAKSSIARAVSRRCGRMAVANYPWLYCFAGRNSILSTLTGVPYQELRFFHILLGGIAFTQSFIHTFTYIGHYVTWQGVDKLKEEYTELYFKMGIVAVVFMAINTVFGLKWLRRRSYEIFLSLHVIGAALILAGSWYHRPVMQPWVYAAAAIWIFERVVRFVWHFAGIANTRLVLRRPVIKAQATVSHGAILLKVPFTGSWSAGQHVYVSFWGLDLLRRPHLYGQSHPFSIANIPSTTASGPHEMQFVLRIHAGVTKELANHISKKCAAKSNGGQEAPAECLVSIEGPHGWAPPAAEYDSVLLVAGGSGITHPLSVLDAVCQLASEGKAVTSSIKLVWALQRFEQTAWIRDTLLRASRLAKQANLSLSIDLYVTRSSSSAPAPICSTPTSTSSSSSSTGDLDEQKDASSGGELVELVEGCKARRFDGRPEIEAEVASVIAESVERTLVVACGPTALANSVRRATSSYGIDKVETQIAMFEC
ncbi:hypothetical protein JCM11641_006861 [Rhodosporidiobolus odoratus]